MINLQEVEFHDDDVKHATFYQQRGRYIKLHETLALALDDTERTFTAHEPNQKKTEGEKLVPATEEHGDPQSVTSEAGWFEPEVQDAWVALLRSVILFFAVDPRKHFVERLLGAPKEELPKQMYHPANREGANSEVRPHQNEGSGLLLAVQLGFSLVVVDFDCEDVQECFDKDYRDANVTWRWSMGTSLDLLPPVYIGRGMGKWFIVTPTGKSLEGAEFAKSSDMAFLTTWKPSPAKDIRHPVLNFKKITMAIACSPEQYDKQFAYDFDNCIALFQAHRLKGKIAKSVVEAEMCKLSPNLASRKEIWHPAKGEYTLSADVAADSPPPGPWRHKTGHYPPDLSEYSGSPFPGQDPTPTPVDPSSDDDDGGVPIHPSTPGQRDEHPAAPTASGSNSRQQATAPPPTAPNPAPRSRDIEFRYTGAKVERPKATGDGPFLPPHLLRKKRAGKEPFVPPHLRHNNQ
ncbi:hypothetical protein PRZ48_010257 [Zasmidium cellare]|uniref:Uncharacterized protein n=1 Tax=Zasmidium cellare TaxID=395010 RepID=A0ABR0E857_ZASCE|nr:hypothetical protein PRZ48_010257 [Zasmidium cellare]